MFWYTQNLKLFYVNINKEIFQKPNIFSYLCEEKKEKKEKKIEKTSVLHFVDNALEDLKWGEFTWPVAIIIIVIIIMWTLSVY